MAERREIVQNPSNPYGFSRAEIVAAMTAWRIPTELVDQVFVIGWSGENNVPVRRQKEPCKSNSHPLLGASDVGTGRFRRRTG